jgi:hypothetical protein
MATAKFHGAVGYSDGQIEKRPGVYVDNIVERTYFGEIKRNTRQLREGESVNRDLCVNNSISIVADAYANEHFHAIKYVEWAGEFWDVDEATVVPGLPRILLRLGGVYNGTKFDRSGGSEA